MLNLRRRGLLLILFLTISLLFLGLIFRESLPSLARDQRINILLLGVAGEGFAGSQLTDTIILASLTPTKNEVVLVSLPRDLYFAELKGKVNSIYALGGLVGAKATISKITGEEIAHAIKIDFAGFIKTVNLVGGLDLEVENSFNDYEYPIIGRENDLCGLEEEETVFPCRFERLNFEKGKTHMDGATALKFVRSRNAAGEEGTDFARSRRQQKVITALKDKLLETKILLNPLKLTAFYRILVSSVESDIPLSRFDDFVRLVQKMRGAKFRSAVLDYGDKEKDRPGLLINPPIAEYGAWVLIPRIGEGNFSEIQKYVRCQIEIGECSIKE